MQGCGFLRTIGDVLYKVLTVERWLGMNVLENGAFLFYEKAGAGYVAWVEKATFRVVYEERLPSLP